ncbi:MAG: SRPBCC domain-containing protein [Paenibacillaceae bacterium]|nr:SRPBCC domain-containing protein [Paenibacillaceae bacterium]
MSEHYVKHATFVVERTYPAKPEQVYRAWSDPEAKAKWFSKPDSFEFRVGGREYSKGGPPDGPVFTFDALYQEIVPEQRIVYTYSLDMDDTRMSVSITTIEMAAVEGGTKLIFTEQGAFFDGHDTPEIREHGTKELLDALGRSLEAEDEPTPGDNELIAVRVFDSPRELVYRAWTTPDLLARWWGPEGFTNTFHECDIRPDGEWRYTMHGPDGKDYPNYSVFADIVPQERVALDHKSGHEFRLTGIFEERGGRTKVTFRQKFKHAHEFEAARPYCEPGNQQNLDRLGKLLEELAPQA